MDVIGKVLKFLGFKSYIKAPGKGFDDLSKADLASMIEAFLEDGNEEFEQNALYEFRLMKYDRVHLEETRKRIIEIEKLNGGVSRPDGLSSSNGQIQLRVLAQALRD